MCAYRVFYRKFNFQQLLFEAFFDIIGNFVSVEPWNESTFLFQYIKIFETMQSLKPPSSTPEGDRHVCSRSFFFLFKSSTTFI